MRLFLGLFVVRYFRFFNLYIFRAKFGYRNIMLFTGVSHFAVVAHLMQFSWLICLFGAVLTYSSQNVVNFNFEKETNDISRRYSDYIMVGSINSIFYFLHKAA